jgi:hypothetical protein
MLLNNKHYYNLPPQERKDLWKHYKKVYPNMGYTDMVKHFNGEVENYQFGGRTDYFDSDVKKFADGGKTNTLEGDLISKVIMNRNKDKDFVKRAYAVGQYPESKMFTSPDPNEFGSRMTHKMSWGEDDKGQAYMFPEVLNPNNEAIKIPNQYADYITSKGYKKVTNIPIKKSKGGLIKKYEDGGTDKNNTTNSIYEIAYGKPQLVITPEEKRKAVNPTYEEQKEAYLSDLKRRGSGRLEESISPLDFIGPNQVKAAANLVKSTAKTLPKAATKAGKYLTEETALKNAYKLNPWAFKPNPEAYYRGIGKSGYDDAIESGVLRTPQGSRFGDDLYLSDKFSEAEYYADNKLPWTITDDGTVVSDLIKSKGIDTERYIAEIPKAKVNAKPYYINDSQFITNEKVRLNDVKLLKQDWLKGYKEVSKPKSTFKSEIDWGKWNPDTPKYPELINEYNAIEESTKKAGTWMKNPDGSAFQGTPEQFVQQQSSWFKKAFGNSKLINPDGSPKIIKHGSEKNDIEIFKSPSQQENFKKRTATTKDTEHIFFSQDDHWVNRFARKDGKVYNVYANVENPRIASTPEEMYNPEIISNYKDYDAITNLKLGEKDTRPFREIAIPNWNNVKSAVGNVGFFDMTNPNIYKGLIPAAISTNLLKENKKKNK